MSKVIVAAVVVIVVAAVGWFFLSPLFIDEVVDEPLAGLPTMPGRAEVMAMPEAERERLRRELMAAAATTTAEVDEAMDMDSPVQLAGGTFVDADAIHRGSGDAAIYRLPDGTHVVRFENFEVTNGPALVVLLARHPDPKSANDVKEGYVKIGKLKGNVGNQNYALPAEIDITSFGSVVIWCELFDVLFSPAALQLY
ncbi:MAG: DM13 domain-containing protein [Gammaproteobacteria bacterium]|nr:DM13 domain-containing protein [Gammaproteobacteria bacterium]